MRTVKTFDTTLRDGAQRSGISLSVDDKIKISLRLDDLGIDYIEGGWPGSNPKDIQYFKEIKKRKLKHSKVTAFGSTRHKEKAAYRDKNLISILESKVKVASIFGKAWDLHVHDALRTSLEENAKMVYDSIRFLKSKGLEVVFDAEHFFDGFKANKDYALIVLKKAQEAGADNISLCDTNGGMLPYEISEIFREVRMSISAPLGIHVHNDSDCAVANTIEAVREGCVLVQGTLNGFGERAGNANLASIIANLKLKMGIHCLTDSQLQGLAEATRYVAEVANQIPNEHQPFVGSSAFAHKGGIHVSALARKTSTYEHIDPSLVGNQRKVLISELSGRSNIIMKAKELKIDFDSAVSDKVIESIKGLENKGYQFEGAEASFALLVKKAGKKFKPFFELKGFRVAIEKNPYNKGLVSEATIKLMVDNHVEHTVAEGDGPVNALDNALRKSLEKFYPQLKEVSLSDFKVRVLDAAEGTAAKVRVFITSRDKDEVWNTIGVSENIIEASWQALVDSIEYKLLREEGSSWKRKN
ncbi:MAG: citramalate synthase [bacterium]